MVDQKLNQAFLHNKITFKVLLTFTNVKTQFVSQEEFERRQKQYDTQKQNSLRKIFSIFAKEKAAAKDQGQSGRRI